ncbi:lactonase family protein [Demequina sp. TTPB684]|uniref:lactonase family protein n=1 Tax=unclassified Demequina TaxID=2620311 RepID=UPI001CF3ED8F|nr:MULTISPECIES: beta-propeller fold lactonase family protein [unclassified Demequina]MCB2413331.1 lactonase family protein [Demequina sp. TTPB684]UPU87470.1 lactonase family protein [Demequina sp. TMPB413]
MTSFFVGTYPQAGLGTEPGKGEGVWRAQIDAEGDMTAAQVTVEPAPSFAVTHPQAPVIYVVEETEPTTVAVWDVGTEPPRELARIDAGGAYGCHALVAPDGATLYVSHYGNGDVSVIPLAPGGIPHATAPAQTVSHEGSGPRSDRQQGPHAHFAAFAPGGRHLLIADLGTDQLRRYNVGADGLLYQPGIAATLQPGSGPRHLAVRGDLIYVVCELDHYVRTLRWDGASGTAEVIAEHQTTLVPLRSGDTLYDAHVDIVHRERGDVLLVSVRGADVISVFDIAPEGELTYRAAFDAGHWPRHFAVVGEQLIVGAERGHEVRAYALADVLALPPESESGAVASLPHTSAPITSPACVVPLS